MQTIGTSAAELTTNTSNTSNSTNTDIAQIAHIEILRPGILTSVQDFGRTGMRHLGVAQSGALDKRALSIANRLLNNPIDAAGLEITIGPVVLRFTQDTWFALAGADFSATLEQKKLSRGWRYLAKAGQQLSLFGPAFGQRAYIAFAGGIDVPVVLGARATDMQAQFGGFHGRALQTGDCLPLGASKNLSLKSREIGFKHGLWTPEIRAIPGPEYDFFDAASQKSFWEHAWRISSQSNRMGFRLLGQSLQRIDQRELPSHAVMPGVVQVPPNGQAIILMADAQTTGGYPKIATIIEADLWKLAQATPGCHFCFVKTDSTRALQAQEEWRSELKRLDWSLHAH